MHKVKCFYCGEIFDRDKEKAVIVTGRRYAHETCALSISSQIEDKDKLVQYIKQLFNYESLPVNVEKQINKFITEYHYTYNGILNSLIYFYEIKNGDKEKAFGKIGIVPYVYNEAEKYYEKVNETIEFNKEEVKKIITIPTKTIIISPPKRNPFKKLSNLFKFLDE